MPFLLYAPCLLFTMASDLDLDFEHYTVAWIAPLEIEAQAAWYMLDHEHRGSFSTNRGDDYVYTAGDINPSLPGWQRPLPCHVPNHTKRHLTHQEPGLRHCERAHP